MLIYCISMYLCALGLTLNLVASSPEKDKKMKKKVVYHIVIIIFAPVTIPFIIGFKLAEI